MALSTDCRFTRDLMLEAVPWGRVSDVKTVLSTYGNTHILQLTSLRLEKSDPSELGEVSPPAHIYNATYGASLRMINDIILVPFPLAASRRLISFFT